MITFIIFFLNKMKTFLLKKRSFFFKVSFLDFFFKGRERYIFRKKKKRKKKFGKDLKEHFQRKEKVFKKGI